MNHNTESSSPYAVSYDLSRCDEEPIHIIRQIQSHAALLVVSFPDYTILHASLNTKEILGIPPVDLLSQNLNRFLDSQYLEQISTNLLQEHIEDGNPIQIDFFGSQKLEEHQNLIINKTSQGILLEFEQRFGGVSRSKFFHRMDRAIQNIQEIQEMDQLFESAAKEIKVLTDYDRVMIYQFDKDYNGTVIAEVKEDQLEAFLGLRYPASDIPSQARALFLKNQVRIIADTKALPSPIRPSLNPQTEEPLDLSLSVARGVSPIHLEYLSNMGVRATMSVAIVLEGKLWGLIACHHYTPKLIDYRLRTMIRFLGRVISGHLTLHATNEFRRLNLQVNKIRSQLFERMGEEWDVVGGLTQSNPSFLDLTEASGGAILLDKQLHITGKTPPVQEVEKLIDWLKHSQSSSVFSTQHLSSVYPAAKGYAAQAAGLLAIRITENEFILWFREEVRQLVTWGGNPEKAISKSEEGFRLSPRKSFEKWQQEVAYTSTPWQNYQIDAAIALRNDVKDFIIQKYQEVKELNADLLKAYQNMESFSYTVGHDLRAPLRSIKGFAEIIQEDYYHQLDEYGKSAIQAIISSVGKMNAFINDILEFSRFDKVKLLISELNLEEQVRESWNILVQGYAHEQKITLHFNQPPKTIFADHRLFRYVLDNLLSNAIKYSKDSIVNKIEVGGKQKEEYTQFYIKDNGIGFDMQYAERIFAVFHRLVNEDEYEGTGIGLAIVKKIIERHKANIWVESELGKGTTFYCEFKRPQGIKYGND